MVYGENVRQTTLDFALWPFLPFVVATESTSVAPPSPASGRAFGNLSSGTRFPLSPDDFELLFQWIVAISGNNLLFV